MNTNMNDIEGIHPELGRIIDLKDLQEMFEMKDSLESHKEALEAELESFYNRAGVSEAFFDGIPLPNVSRQIYAKWVKLRHDYLYQAPNYRYVADYIDLAFEVNEMLFGGDFDECLKLFETKLKKLGDKRIDEQMKRALADSIQKLKLDSFDSLREEEDLPLTGEDVMRCATEFLKADHGWSDEQCAELVRVSRQN